MEPDPAGGMVDVDPITVRSEASSSSEARAAGSVFPDEEAAAVPPTGHIAKAGR